MRWDVNGMWIGHVFKNWKRRWFKLWRGEALCYYSKEIPTGG